MEPANLLKIETLSDSWCDKDDVILHACFQLLKDFVEQEKEMFEIIDWNHTEENKLAKAEIDFLYNWWINRNHDEDDLDKINEQYQEDNQMLKRLIDVRKHLWTQYNNQVYNYKTMSVTIETRKTKDRFLVSIPTDEISAEEIEEIISSLNPKFVLRKSEMTEVEAETIFEELTSDQLDKKYNLVEEMKFSN